ncbi:MAG: type IV secretory system conjugative DNA transfer family protein [Clostridia bacterium]|jgi:type IV secretion system protein VirD4|nr:type IV secretory system conjugative DNA transfer family protein [Clostridia bacterium]
MFIGFVKTAPKNEYTDIEQGSSDWASKGEQYKVLSNKKGIILAENNYLPVDKRGNVNVLVVGGSGSGKSASFSIPNAYQMLGSYVFTDPKGELYDKTAGYLKKNGYEIKVLNLVRPQNSDGYNPLMHVSSELDVDVIASTIIKGQKSESGSDPYWDDMAELLLKALIYYLIATRPEEEQNLASCAELVRAANNKGGNNLLSELMNQLPYDHPARMYYKSIEIAPEKTYGSILSSLQSKLGKFDSKEIAELTSTDTIDFEEIGKKKTAVYVISSDTHTAYDFLLTIFFAQMIQQLYDFADKCNGLRLPIQTFFILDEFANIGQVPDFDKKISTSRSRGIQFSVILQNLDQLEAVYEKSYETIIGNCDTHVFLGSNSQKTVEYFSKALGEKTVERTSISVNKDRQNWMQGKSVSDQINARALLTPDELRRFDNDYCIIFEKGIRPIKAKKYYYFTKPEARRLAEFKLNHNEDRGIERGKWRKYNPYNPYVEDKQGEKEQDLKVESLDDLFEEENKKEEPKEQVPVKKSEEEFAPILPQEEEVEAPNLLEMMEEEKEQEETGIDLQKELEAKFDELFGPIDEE